MRSQSCLYGRVGWGVRQVGVGWDVFFVVGGLWDLCRPGLTFPLFLAALLSGRFWSFVVGCVFFT